MSLLLGPLPREMISMLFTTSCLTDSKVTSAWPLPSEMTFHAFHNILLHRQQSHFCLAPAKWKWLSMLFTTSCHADSKVTSAWPLPSEMAFHAVHNILLHRQQCHFCLAPAKRNDFPCFSQHLVTQTGKSLLLGSCQVKCLSMLFTTSCSTDSKVTSAWPLPSEMTFHAFHNILPHRQQSHFCLAPAK